MNAIVGQPISRVDGPAKVTGQAIYAAEFKLHNMAHAALVHSTIPSGRIIMIDPSEALRAPGVLSVITHENAPRLPYRPLEEQPQVDPKSGDQLHVFQGPEVQFDGQPIAVILAETREQAQGAVPLVRVRYQIDPATTRFETAGSRPPSEESGKAGRPAEAGRGDADTALQGAAVSIDMRCSHAREHHNPIEPPSRGAIRC